MELKWKEDSNNTHRIFIGGMDIRIHRWVHQKDKWFLSIRNGPLFYDRYPLAELDIESVKKEVINKLINEADKVQNALHVAAERDSKKIENFKLRLVAILNQLESIDTGCAPDWTIDGIEKLEETIKKAMSDL